MGDLPAPDGIRTYFTNLFARLPRLAVRGARARRERRARGGRWRVSATFAGPGRFQGVNPTGARVEIEGCDMLRVEDELIVENNAYTNGALSRPAARPAAALRLGRRPGDDRRVQRQDGRDRRDPQAARALTRRLSIRRPGDGQLTLGVPCRAGSAVPVALVRSVASMPAGPVVRERAPELVGRAAVQVSRRGSRRRRARPRRGRARAARCAGRIDPLQAQVVRVLAGVDELDDRAPGPHLRPSRAAADTRAPAPARGREPARPGRRPRRRGRAERRRATTAQPSARDRALSRSAPARANDPASGITAPASTPNHCSTIEQ